ncbi:NAD(P)/FAD-dependent oxidoreductase [Weeksellaceae bacterium KMM 9713]|uniref:NAD(P)/FAD-dependent oxidoreductase n=1 Tax=Profundicola chukchiensis TaxID=2961959 RepID=A0A9X4MXG0_9FLAO|nr:NAD(P)/FAD-dependent oxidoreductase [Profundicola chukchiensis]MDG4945325.1 NAD(P)/FAD-dependent oxidoreductase [Profundicola chukchiensis]
MKVAIIGGGAAGFFLGAQLAPPFFVEIFEKAMTPLQKVKISGGGRCNVTHACFDPNILVDFYPRGNKELKSVFGRFQPGDTMGWFEERGVPLKIQDDMRVFPVSDNSQDIVGCLIKENQNNKNKIHLGEAVKEVIPNGDTFILKTSKGEYEFDKVVFAPGSSKQVWQMIEKLGHSIVPPVPSLFTFNCKDSRINGLQGTSFQNVDIKILDSNLENHGDLLITHWGFSGPAVLVLSAIGARELYEKKYKFSVQINFIGYHVEDALETLFQHKQENARQKMSKFAPFGLTKRFWMSMLENVKVDKNLNWSDIPDKKLRKLSFELTQGIYEINGKSTYKDEFVTAGGVELKEINFKTMESKIVPGIYFAGEVLNIDAVTGGFNFQACWSESFIIAETLKTLQ